MTTTSGIPGNRPLQVFLSYSHADHEWARKLRDVLSHLSDLRIFTMDALSAGEDWQSRLRRELSECDVFMILWSGNSLASRWVTQELGAAWGLDKPIIPVITQPHLSPKLPFEVGQLQSFTLGEFEDPEVLREVLEPYRVSSLTRVRPD